VPFVLISGKQSTRDYSKTRGSVLQQGGQVPAAYAINLSGRSSANRMASRTCECIHLVESHLKVKENVLGYLYCFVPPLPAVGLLSIESYRVKA
jgi:hypothetical protein